MSTCAASRLTLCAHEQDESSGNCFLASRLFGSGRVSSDALIFGELWNLYFGFTGMLHPFDESCEQALDVNIL